MKMSPVLVSDRDVISIGLKVNSLYLAILPNTDLEGHVHVSLHVALVLEDVLQTGGHVRHDLGQVIQAQALGNPDIDCILKNKMPSNV